MGRLRLRHRRRITFAVLVCYGASLLAAPVLAYGQSADDRMRISPAPEELPLEPDTRFDPMRWYDNWWDTAVKGIAGIPSGFVQDLTSTYGALKSIFQDGIKVGNVLILRGTPDTLRVLKYHGEQLGIHYIDTIRMLPEHAVKAGDRFVQAGKDIGQTAASRARHTAEFTRKQADSIAQLQQDSWILMKAMGEWTGEGYSDSAQTLARDLKDHARWTIRQVPEGIEDTKRWATWVADHAIEGVRETARFTADTTAAYAGMIGPHFVDRLKATGEAANGTAKAAGEAATASERFFGDRAAEAARTTLGHIPGEIKRDAVDTASDAKWLWKQGYEKGLQGGLSSAADNFFAGDVEGVTVGTFYSLAAVAQGVAFVLVLEPLDFTAHTGWGVIKTTSLAFCGTAFTSSLAAMGVASGTAIRAGGAALSMGVAAVGTGLTALSAAGEGVGMVGTAALGSVATAGIAVGGAVATAGAGAAGVARTAGATVAGGLRMGGDVAWSAVKMVGITAAGATAEVLIPAVDATITSVRIGAIAGNAIVDNAIVTPAVATWDILSALTMAGWELVRDPVYGTYHLVAGATGFSYQLVGLSTAFAVTAVAGALYAVAKAPLSLVYYGGMWMIAAGAKLIDTATAPLGFSTQNHWKEERKPQLEAILGRQAPTVLDEIGSEITYIRVVFSGVDRGKVNFFTTEKGGKVFRFHRRVRENCLVVYDSPDTPIILDSGQYDRACMEERNPKGVGDDQ